MNNQTPKPLGLSDEQLDIVLDKAHYIAPEWRSRFLAGVVDQLTNEVLTNSMIESACISVAMRMRAKGRKGNDEDDRQVQARCGGR